MKVTGIETLTCDAGWRNYHFVKLTTDSGIVGWSEFDEGFGSPGVGAVIAHLTPRVVGQPVGEHERIYAELYCITRPGAGSVVAQAMGAIENALIDAKAKGLGVPCYELLGGKVRDRIRVYWSHCATWRINHPSWYKPAITDLDGVKAMGAEVREKRFTAMKTNIFMYEQGAKNPKGWRPGFGAPFYPELNVDRNVLRNLRMHLEALRDGAGPDVDMLLDLNFNAKTEGYLKILREIARPRHVLGRDRQLQSRGARLHPPSEPASDLIVRDADRLARVPTLFPRAGDGCRHRRRAVERHLAVDEGGGAGGGHEVNVAPHNFYGHLCTMMAAHFCAAVPNLRIMETDIDRLAWDDELVSHPPVFENGHLVVPDRPGWGTEPNEDAIRAHPPKGKGGLLNYGSKK